MYRNGRSFCRCFWPQWYIRNKKFENAGGGAKSLKGGEIPRDLAPGRAKSLGISPLGEPNPCDTGSTLTKTFCEYILSFLYDWILFFFWPRLNIPIFLPILSWKYYCNILNFPFRDVLGVSITRVWCLDLYSSHYIVHVLHRYLLQLVRSFLTERERMYCIYKFSTHEIIFFS